MSSQAWAPIEMDGLSRSNFDRVSRYIYQYCGIRMPASKVGMLEGRLRRRLRATGHRKLNEYCDYLFDQNGIAIESVHLIDAVTTNKTDFFRESKHFDYLEQVALPELEKSGVRKLRAWSAACSTGAEPYSMAMVMEDFVQKQRAMDYEIIATDISTNVLAVGIKGVYPEDQVEPVPERARKQYVMRSKSPGAGVVRIHPRLRSKVGFGRMNLMDTAYDVGGPVHVIFCRNVLIYFERPLQGLVLRRLCENLREGGYLFIGHSESVAGFDLPIVPVGHTIFRKQSS
jgi:chemotaxis protein methyltransferase CheR